MQNPTPDYHILKTTAAGTFMMLGATMAWGSSYLFMQLGLHSIEPFNLIALRFGIGFLAALPFFAGKLSRVSTQTIGRSALLGLLLCAAFWSVMSGLLTSTTGQAAFLGGSTVIFVQLEFALLSRRRPETAIAAAALLAFGGIALMTLRSSLKISIGDLFCLGAAFVYSWHIILSGRFLRKSDPAQLGVLQLGWAALFAATASLFLETPQLPHGGATWTAVLFLGLVCSGLGFILQAEAQKRIDPGRTGVIFAMEPVFAMTLGMAFLGETLAPRAWAGAACIICAVLFASSRISKTD